MLIFNPNLGEEKIDQAVAKIEEKIKGWGGEHKKTEKWGTKRLMSVFRKTNKLQQGFYLLVFFDSDPSVPAKLQAYLKVSEFVVRYSVYKSPPQKEEKLAEIAGVPLENKDVLAIGVEPKKAIPGPAEGKTIG